MSPIPSIRTHRPNSRSVRPLSAGLAPLFAAAGLVLLAPAAHAAEPAGDAQSQARSILLATTSFEVVGGPREGASHASVPDVQEQARSILLSKQSYDTGSANAATLAARSQTVPTPIAQGVRRADAQESARALLLGRGS